MGVQYLRRVYREPDPLLGHLIGEHVSDLAEHRHEVQRHRLELFLPGLDPAHLEDVVYERHQVVARRLHLADVLAHLRDIVAGAARELDVSDDGIHRGADVVAYRREERALRAVPRRDLRLRDLERLLPSPLDRVQAEHYHERAGEKRHLHDVASQPLVVQLGHLARHEVLLVVQRDGVRPAVVLGAVPRLAGDDRVYRPACRVLRRQADPHERREDDQDHDARPDHGRAPEALEAVVLEHLSVQREPDDAPEREDKVRLGGQNAPREVVRHEQKEAEHHGHHRADDPRHPGEHVAVPAGELERRRRGDAVGHRGAYAGHVHRPADDSASEERDDQRNAYDEQNGIARRAVPVELPEPLPLRQDVVRGKRIQQAAHRNSRRDYSGEDAGEHRRADQRNAPLPEHALRGRESRHRVEPGKPDPRADVVRPRRILHRMGEDGQDGEHKVHRHGRGDRREEDPEEPLRREPELRRRVRHGLEADERPRHHGQDAQHLRDIRPAVGHEGRGHRGKSAVMPRKRDEEGDRHGGEHERRERGLHAAGEPAAVEAHQAGDHHDGNREQDLAEVDVESGERVVPAELQDVAEHIADEQHERSSVRPEDRHVREREGPGREVSIVRAERLVRVAARASGPWIGRDHLVVVPGDDGHHGRADENAQCRPQRTSVRKEHRAGHHERAPSDGIAERKPPHGECRQVLFHENVSLSLP